MKPCRRRGRQAWPTRRSLAEPGGGTWGRAVGHVGRRRGPRRDSRPARPAGAIATDDSALEDTKAWLNSAWMVPLVAPVSLPLGLPLD